MAASVDSKVNMENFIAFAQEKSAEFFCLDLVELGKFLLDENLVVENEKDAFEALHQWVMHSPTERLAGVPKLLPLIRLNQLEPEYLATTVKSFAAEAGIGSLIDSAIQRQSLRLDQRENFAVEFQTKPRMSATEVVMCSFYYDSIAKYSTRTKQWTSEEAEELSALNLRPAHCMRGKFEMIIYDRNEERFLVLNLITLDYKALPPMLDEYEVATFTVEIIDDTLYVLDGSVSVCDLGNSCQRFNFTSGKWSEMKSMNIPTAGHCSAVLNGKIYIAGGFPNCSVDCYDPTTDEWSLQHLMLVHRFNANESHRTIRSGYKRMVHHRPYE